MDVRQHFKTRPQALAHRGLPDVSSSPRVWTPRHVETAVLGEVRHDPVEIMRVERFGQLLQNTQVFGYLGHRNHSLRLLRIVEIDRDVVEAIQQARLGWRRHGVSGRQDSVQ